MGSEKVFPRLKQVWLWGIVRIAIASVFVEVLPQFDELGSEKVMFISEAETLSREASEDMSVSKVVCAVARIVWTTTARMREARMVIVLS